MSQYEDAFMYQATPNNIWSSIHEKVKEHRGCDENSVAYQKKRVYSFYFSFADNLFG